MMPPKGKTNEKGESTEEGMLEYVPHLICCCCCGCWLVNSVNCTRSSYAVLPPHTSPGGMM